MPYRMVVAEIFTSGSRDRGRGGGERDKLLDHSSRVYIYGLQVTLSQLSCVH